MISRRDFLQVAAAAGLLAGGGNGKLKPGRHLKYTVETPMANLFLTMLDKMGVTAEQLGDSNDKLGYLGEL